jgi:hypothetical protein
VRHSRSQVIVAPVIGTPRGGYLASPRGLAALRNKAATRPCGAANLEGRLQSFFRHRPQDASFRQHYSIVNGAGRS